MSNRGSGILLHITSLPSSFGVGDLGSWAHEFAGFLAAAEQKYWQILPMNPTDIAFDNSPYHSYSAFAFNPLLISLEMMADEGWLDQKELPASPDFPNDRVDYRRVIPFKRRVFQRAYEGFAKEADQEDYQRFCTENESWLEDYSLFMALKSRFPDQKWNRWPAEIRDRQPEAMKTVSRTLYQEVQREKFLQYAFDRQWNRLKDYCSRKGILIIGDIPIYVVYDSVDLWIHPELFQLDAQKEPKAVAGVPPDYFSKTGQLWGNPLYQWDVLQQRRYDWWINRIKHNLRLFDLVRIDHFRGFVGYWEIPASEKTAVSGKWVKAPARDFFNELKLRIPSLPIVAEDLGTITPDVREVMDHFGLPGMKVLLFAFGDEDSDHPYLPHTYEKNCLAYTGTHDNNTVKGWFMEEATPEDRNRVFRYLGRTVPAEDIHWEFIRLGMKSAADRFIVPMQDVLGLGEGARMNRPATKRGNWSWRLLPEQVSPTISERLGRLTKAYDRA